ncbi:MAG: SDR family NAD(P)-dependent oxidoreductase [Clostridia bacterium]
MRTALITGGSRGIGAAMVRAFTAAGYRVVFLYQKSKEAAEALAHETGAQALCCDITHAQQVSSSCAEALRCLSHIDVLVNNAGIAQQKLFCELSDEDWKKMLDTNLSGAFYGIRAVLPSMISRKQGRIVNISSVWGQVGASCEVHYSAAKAGLIGLSKALAKEVAPSGITVNCVCPGVIETDMLADFDEAALAQMREETPLGRLGTAAEVADCVLWLCSAGAGFVTGQVIGVNGGFGE